MSELVYIDSKEYEKLKEEIKQLKKENLEYKRKYRNYSTDAFTYKKQIKQLESDVDELKREKEELKEKSDLLNKALFDAYSHLEGNTPGIELATNTSSSLIEEVKDLRSSCKEKDEKIEQLEKEKAKRKLRGNKRVIEAIRDLVTEMISYAEKFPAEQNDRALAIKDVLNTKMVNMHIPQGVLDDKLLPKLNSLGLKPINHIKNNYETGSTHNDYSTQLNLDKGTGSDKLLE